MNEALKFASAVILTAISTAVITCFVFQALTRERIKKLNETVATSSCEVRRAGCYDDIEKLRKEEARIIFSEIKPEAEARHREIVRNVSLRTNLWTAKYNPSAAVEVGLHDVNYGLFQGASQFNKLLNAAISRPSPFQEHDKKLKNLPDAFDSREMWPKCTNIRRATINQGACGSCWVVSAVSMISDRICIHSNQTLQVHLSAQDALNCMKSTCLDGGYEPEVLIHWVTRGIVTGGPYGSVSGCLPYEFSSDCGTPCSPKHFKQTKTPKPCDHKCRDGYPVPYDEDKHYGKYSYTVTKDDDGFHPEMKNLLTKAEIFLRGPVTGYFVVAEDFLHYASGIYHHVAGDLIYQHAVKIIGWGKENGTEYWIVSNSFGSDWGDNGFFRIAMRGEYVELSSAINAGIPDFDGKVK